MDSLEKLKFNIREKEYPCFTDDELKYLLEEAGGDVRQASYNALIMKSENTGLSVSGLTTKDTSGYFRRLASRFVKRNSRVLK